MLDSEDITQSAFVRYWRRFPDGNCDQREPFRVLLYLARLCAINAIRKATRYRRSEQLRTSTETATLPYGQNAPSILDHIPESLSPFVSALLAGYSQRELYDQYGQHTVRMWSKRLRECLAN